jgi:uncharacterized membrane protein YraQ (UPF0718 family)
MNAAIRWRIIVLQVVAIFVLAIGTVGAYAAYSFTNTQIHDQLAPQQIFFPKDAASGLPDNLKQYAGQQVLTGEQAHAYAEKYIGLHLSETGQGHPYSYWSGKAIADRAAAAAATDPTIKANLTAQAAKEQGTADTMFKGETLKGLLNEAYAFSVFGQIAFYATIGLGLAGLVVLGALLFELIDARRSRYSVAQLATTTPIREPVAVN